MVNWKIEDLAGLDRNCIPAVRPHWSCLQSVTEFVKQKTKKGGGEEIMEEKGYLV